MKKIVTSIFFVLVSFLSQAQQPTLSLFDLPVQDATNYADAYDYWFPDNDTVTVMPVYLFDLENYLQDVDSFSLSVTYNPNEIKPVLDVINTVNTQSFITSVGYVLPIIQLAMVYGDTVMPNNLISSNINTISNDQAELSVSCTFYNDSTFYADSEGCLIYIPFKILNRCGDANYSLDIVDAELFSNTCSQNVFSIEFDGIDDYVNYGFLNLDADFSIEGWWNKGIGSLNNPFWCIGDVMTGGLELYVGSTGTVTKLYHAGSTVLEATSNPNSGSWHHYAVVREAGIIKLYIDGVQDPNVWLSNVVISGDLNIGQEIYGGGNSFNAFSNGFIDNFGIWNIALSQQEIQQYMNCPPIGIESGLVYYWNFEEGAGSTVYDLTSNANNGTINGAIYNTEVPLANTYTSFISTQDSTLSMVDGSIVLSSIEVSVNEFMGNIEAIVDNNFGNLIYTWSTGETDPYITPSPNVDSYWVSVCDEEGCCDTSDVYSLSLNNVVSKTEITLYPNPSKGDFLLSFNNNKNIKTKIDITSLNGSLVSSYETKECFLLMENNELKGIYFLRVFNKEIDAITKLIIID